MTTTAEERTLFAAELRRLVDGLPSGADAAARAERLAGVERMGLVGLTVPAAEGGQGAGVAELAAVGEAFGRVLLDVPYLGSSVIAGELLWRCGTTERRPLDGSPRTCVALDVRRGARVGGVTVDADGLVTGQDLLTVDGASAGTVLVVTDSPHPQLVEIPLDADGVTQEQLDAVDPTRSLRRLAVRYARGEVLAEGRQVGEAASRAMAAGWLYLAAESLGAAAACLQQMVRFARLRTTFDRQIGSYQAIKHRCVDRWIDVERARALVEVVTTGWATDDRVDTGVLHLAVAASLDALQASARDNVLVHGAIGFTAEHQAHRFVRRARASRALLGSPHWHRLQATLPAGPEPSAHPVR